MKERHWLILSWVCCFLVGVLFGWRAPDMSHCPDCTCSAMRVVTAPDGSLIDLSDYYLVGNGIGILFDDSPSWTPVPDGQIGTGSYVRAYPAGYIGYVANVSTFGEVTGTSSDRIAYRVCVTAWEPDCRWLGETNVEPYTPMPTPASTPTSISCDDPDGLCIGSQWIGMLTADDYYNATLTIIGEVDGVIFYDTNVSGPMQREEFLATFTLWEVKE